LEEKSGEIHPVGYPGRIAGIKIRLILATSDPRIARFAGYNLLGADRSRSDQEMERSMRHDLLFRVKGQVIRTEAIKTQESLWASLEEMIDRHSNPEWLWTLDAKEYLAGQNGEITRILAELGSSNDPTTPRFMVFGQRRELKRIIDLANAYMESAERRGLRLKSNEITKQIVQEIWKPSELRMTKPTANKSEGQRHDPEFELCFELNSDEEKVRKAILTFVGKEELLSVKAFQNYVRPLNAQLRKELKDKLYGAAGCDSASRKELPKKQAIIGRIFKYPGKTRPQSEDAYGKQVGQWLSQQVFSKNNK